MTTTSRPASPTQDLWSSILDSVSSSRSIPSKQILILGEPGTGKSTIASALLQKQIADNSVREDFALGYGWADVRDDADEDTLARLSVYTVQSSNPIHLALIPQVLPAKTSLANTLVMILLDWTKPWTFIEHLETWLSWVDNWAKGDGSREMDVLRDEGRERLQYHLQHYTESTGEDTAAVPTTTLAGSAVLPLPQGSYTKNPSGTAIMVVCTKADLIDDNSDVAGVGAGGMGGMVKGKGGEWEERTDGVMQVLRTICLKYGAALFYTSPLPTTTSILRQYALHYLCIPNPPQAAIGSSEVPAPVKNPFQFNHPANVLDRDRIVIPAGWDSYGKISILREGFEPARWSEAFDKDMEALGEGSNSAAVDPRGAKGQFAVLVGGDRGPPPRQLPPIIQPTPEQNFLQHHYESLAKDSSRDPRNTFKQGAEGPDRFAGGIGASGVVGPLGGSSFGLPSVQRALDGMDGVEGREKEGERAADRGAARPSTTTTRRDASRPVINSGQPPFAGPPRTTIASPTSASGGGRTEHEVLHNFFQSLLTKGTKPALSTSGGPGAAGGSSGTRPPPANPPEGGQ